MKKYLRTTAVLGAALLLASCGSTSEAPVENEPAGTSQEATAEETPKAVEPQPFNVSGLLAGNAAPNFGEGDPGEVTVVHIGAMLKDSGTLLFAFRNNTSEVISHIDWTATARSGGSIVGSGSSQGTAPSQVQPGEIGLSYIYFDNAESIPDDAEYEFQVATSPADPTPYNTAPFRVTEANLVGDAIVGGATNETGASATGPFSVSIYCFEGDQLVDQMTTFADQQGPIADGGTVSFSNNLYGNSCETFALGVSGWFE